MGQHESAWVSTGSMGQHGLNTALSSKRALTVPVILRGQHKVGTGTGQPGMRGAKGVGAP